MELYHCETNMLDPLYEENAEFNKTMNFSEVERQCLHSKNGKSVGCEKISNEVLKNKTVMRMLEHFYNLIFDTSFIPSDWMLSIISPIPKGKSSDPRDPTSCRGTNLLSCVYKIYGSVLNNRLIKFLEKNDILHDAQNGLRPNRSTKDHIFTLNSILRKRLNNKDETYVAYIDFAKAFDTASRPMMYYRLSEIGVDGKFYNAFKTMYSKTSSTIRLNNKYFTQEFDTHIGTHQGDTTAPVLFSILIDSLLRDLQNGKIGIEIGTKICTCLAFADDIVLSAELQQLLQILETWTINWRMKVNTSKTKNNAFQIDRDTCNTT